MAKQVGIRNLDKLFDGVNEKEIVKEFKNKNSKKTTTKKETIETPIENNNLSVEAEIANEKTDREEFRDKCVDIFGAGYSDNEYNELYRLFNKLANNYPLRTSFHIEALATYVKYAYRRNVAIAEGDAESAKLWGSLAKDQADKAKINPNQLSAADLSDGMTSFSQLSQVVEKAQDIIPLLPQFREEPKDRVDYTLWEYINYTMHLLGKPSIPYSDIYKFLDTRYESLKKRYKFMKKEDDGNFDENDIDSED